MRIAVLFGGRAPEHEVSIITGIQVLHALSACGHDLYPIYITKEGEWFLGDDDFYKPETFIDQKKAVVNKRRVFLSLKPNSSEIIEEGSGLFKPTNKYHIDVFFPTFHGRFGEDGSIQGLFEIAGVSYVGCNVQASTIGMDKILSKVVADRVGIPVLSSNWCSKKEWQNGNQKLINKLMTGLRYPVFVKPARLGSSIAINRVENQKQLKEALEVAFFYDTRVLVEQGLDEALEVNISLIGNGPYEFSVTESSQSSGKILSYEDKYISNGKGVSQGMATARRIVPAPITKQVEAKIKDYAHKFFAEIDGSGICRIDFLVSKNKKKIYFNEINTLPGSIAFYLWDKKGISIDKLVKRLVQLGIERKMEREKLITTFSSNILEGYRGAKFGKLTKLKI